MKSSILLSELQENLVIERINVPTINEELGVSFYEHGMDIEAGQIIIGRAGDILDSLHLTCLDVPCTFLCGDIGEEDACDSYLPLPVGFAGNLCLFRMPSDRLYRKVSKMIGDLYRLRLLMYQLNLQNAVPQEIVDSASGFLKSSIILVSPGFSLICARLWDEESELYKCNPLLRELFKNKRLKEDEILASHTSAMEHSGFSMTMQKIKYEQFTVGRAVYITKGNQSGNFLEEVNIVGGALQYSLQKSNYAIYKENEYLTEFIIELIEKKLVSRDLINSRREECNLKPGRYYCVRIQFTGREKYVPFAYNMHHLRTLFPKGYVIVYREEIVVLAAHDPETETPMFDRELFRKFLADHKAYAGVSHGAINLYALPIQYEEAGNAIKLGSVLGDDRTERLFFIEVFKLYHVIDIISQEYSKYYNYRMPVYLSHPAITKLYRYDLEHGTDLVNVLYCYLSNNANAVKAAGKLYMHRNTLVSKLDKIKRITMQDLEDGIMQNTLLFAIMVLRYITIYRGESPFDYKAVSEDVEEQ